MLKTNENATLKRGFPRGTPGGRIHISTCRTIAFLGAIILFGLGLYRPLNAQVSTENYGPSNATGIEYLLKYADRAVDENQWQHAQGLFEKALDLTDENGRSAIRKHLQWVQANLAVQQRYNGSATVDSHPYLNKWTAQIQLQEVVKLIQNNYYQKIDSREIMTNAMLQLEAVICNDGISGRDNSKKNYKKELRKLITSARNDISTYEKNDMEDILHIAKSLQRASKDAGLGESWPARELGYALAASLDKYSRLLNPEQYATLRDQMAGNYVGIGVDMVFEQDRAIIFDVVIDSPAYNAGIMPGDILVEVNDLEIVANGPQTAGKLLVGPQNTNVSISVMRKNKKIQANVKRKFVDAPSVRYVRLLENDKKTGYIRIASFDNDTALELRRAVDLLVKNGAKSLLIDLRANGGGIMRSAIDAVRLFVNQGTIVTVKTALEKTRYCASSEQSQIDCYKLPLAILVDQNTASAAEIFTAALKDHCRATIIGQQTLGKAVVQTVYQLSNNKSALCITTASFQSPSKKNFHKIGIDPDINVSDESISIEEPISVALYLSNKDPVLLAGKNFLVDATRKISKKGQ